MAVRITGVERGTPARRAGIKPGDTLISINKNPITDVLDYRFYMTDEHLELLLCDAERQVRTVQVEKEEYEDLGLEFETYLMDKQMGCRNKCIFCFVDQMPKGMRKSLYFKDDDTRMSFLFGNYTTLTNLKESDIQRIIKMRISPINVSVHTTNPQLRVQMMGNPFAGEALKFIPMMTEAGIRVNTQFVLCPGINDGPELERSLEDLGKLLPGLQSISAVPVGLTRHREGLYPLRTYTKEEAAQVVDIMEHWGDKFLQEYGTRTAYASDEFYLLAERPLPDCDFYEDFSQLESGVGMMTLMEHDFALALEQAGSFPKAQRFTMATGELAWPMIDRFARQVEKQFPGTCIQAQKIVNHYFGETVTVAGLVTATDLLEQLSGLDLGERLLLPANMLRHEQDRFLDDMTLEEFTQRIGVPVVLVENDAFALLDAMLDQPAC